MAIDSAASAASQASYLFGQGAPRSVVWRFTVLALLDEYETRRRRHGRDISWRMFEGEPTATGEQLIDNALGAFVEYLAERDHFPVPIWAKDPLELTHPRHRGGGGKYARKDQQSTDDEQPLLEHPR